MGTTSSTPGAAFERLAMLVAFFANGGNDRAFGSENRVCLEAKGAHTLNHMGNLVRRRAGVS